MDLAEIRGLAGRGLFLRAMEAARRLADDPRPPVQDRIQALLLACRCASEREMHPDAVALAERARGMAEAMGEEETAALARFFAGRALVAAGAPGDAEGHLLAFLAAMERHPALGGHRASALYNLAVAYERLRRPEAAIALYRQAADLDEESGDAVWAIYAHLNATWLLLRLHRADDAASHLDRAALLLPRGLPHQRADHQALQAVYCLGMGRQGEAADLAEEVLCPPGAPGASEWSRTCAAWVAAEVAVLQNRLDLARTLLAAALRHAPDCRDVALMNLVTCLRRRLADGE